MSLASYPPLGPDLSVDDAGEGTMMTSIVDVD
jgi:hypothetical protein